MANNVSTAFVQSLNGEINSLDERMKEIAKSTINDIMNENITNNLRQIISEAEEEEDSFTTDEVEDVKPEEDSDETVASEEDVTVDTDTTEDGSAADTEETSVEEFDVDTTGEDEDIWNDLESLKGEDGEYDLTGMDKEGLIKVMQVMTPADGVRVIKNDNGTVTLTDDTTEKEYVIDLDFECADDDVEDEYEVEVTTEGKVNLGYGVHQKETAMTTPPNKEVAPNGARTWDKVPEGGERRFGNGVGDGDPYDENVNEETVIEMVCDDTVNETMTTQEEGPYARGTGMQHANTNKKPIKGRNSSEGGQKVKGTGEAPYSNAQLESLKRKVNAIWKENKELKECIIPALKKQLQENILINSNMGKIMKLVTKNSTTIEEKKDIFNRFSAVKNEEESVKLYNTISEELKRNGKSLNMNNVMNSQISESKNYGTEKPMYQSEELSNALDLIKRMNKM